MPLIRWEKTCRCGKERYRQDINKVIIIGSDPIVIGQACEFDYSGTQTCKGLRELGYEIVLVNSSPATIMTDPEMADVTYIEPLNLKSITKIMEKGRPDALLPNLGSQTGLNSSPELARAGILANTGGRSAVPRKKVNGLVAAASQPRQYNC